MAELLKQQAQAVPGPFTQSFLASGSNSRGLLLLLLLRRTTTSGVFRVSGRFLEAIASSVRRGTIPYDEIKEVRLKTLWGEKRRGPGNWSNFPPNKPASRQTSSRVPNRLLVPAPPSCKRSRLFWEAGGCARKDGKDMKGGAR